MTFQTNRKVSDGSPNYHEDKWNNVYYYLRVYMSIINAFFYNFNNLQILNNYK